VGEGSRVRVRGSRSQQHVEVEHRGGGEEEEEEEEGFGGGGVTHSPRMPLSRSQLTLGPPDCTHTLRIMFGAVSGRGG